jgi:hypothetical protein
MAIPIILIDPIIIMVEGIFMEVIIEMVITIMAITDIEMDIIITGDIDIIMEDVIELSMVHMGIIKVEAIINDQIIIEAEKEM